MPTVQSCWPVPTSHFLSKCKYLPPEDCRAIALARYTHDHAESDPEDNYGDDQEHIQESTIGPDVLITARRVDIVQSPYLHMFYKHQPIRLTIDCAASTSMTTSSCAERLITHTPCISARLPSRWEHTTESTHRSIQGLQQI